MICSQQLFWINDALKGIKPKNSLGNTVAEQYKLYSPNTEGFQRELSSRSCQLWNSQKDAEEKARAWANAAMVSCVADPQESEAKCTTNKRRESNWHLSEIGL